MHATLIYIDNRVKSLKDSIKFYKDYADSMGEHAHHAAEAHQKISAMHETIRVLNDVAGFIVTSNRAQL